MARFRVVTRHQVSGWRFLLRRLEHALVRRETSMIDDPGRGRSTALTVGFALACVCIAGSAVLGFFKPAKVVGNSRIVADKDSGALYVRIGERLHPALNLTSARLIIGSPDKPVQVPRAELEKYPRGPWVGIPGAPANLVDAADRHSSWAICDTAQLGAAAPVDPENGLPTAARAGTRSTVIGAPLRPDPGAARALAEGQARLLRGDDTVWLAYRDPDAGIVRAALHMADTAVLLALGIDSTAPVLAVSKGLLAAIPEAPPLRVPEIPGAGEELILGSGYTVTVGSVLTVSSPGREAAYYVVSKSGVVRVNPVLAAMIRNADSRGAVSTRAIGPDTVASALRPGAWPGTERFPSRPVELVDAQAAPVTCYHWSRGGTDTTATGALLIGTRLPLSESEQARTVALVTAAGSRGRTADAAYLPRTTGQFVQVTGSDPISPRREALFWISDSGVRYGIDADPAAAATDATLRALALHPPVPAPWSVVSLFAPGPTLSQRDARIQHDGIPVNLGATGLGGTP